MYQGIEIIRLSVRNSPGLQYYFGGLLLLEISSVSVFFCICMLKFGLSNSEIPDTEKNIMHVCGVKMSRYNKENKIFAICS